jgi:hypothetical protein
MHCLSCGYNLRGLDEERCPECGRGFSTTDARTFGAANTHRLLRWANRIGWGAAVMALGVGAASALGIASGEYDIVLPMTLWIVAFIPVSILTTAYSACRAGANRWVSARAVAVTLLLIAFNASLFTQWPIHAAFLAQRDALNRSAQRVLNQPTQAQTPAALGLFTAHDIVYRNDSGHRYVIFTITTNTSGPDHFVYGMTDNQIENTFNLWSYERLDSNWHIVHED